MKIKALVKSLALTAGLVASFSSSADFMDFQVDERPYGGEIVTADKFNGGYTETLTLDSDGNFFANAAVTLGAIFGNDGSSNASQIGSLVGNTYKLYALFEASGTYSLDGPSPTLNGNSGSFTLYLDANNDFSASKSKIDETTYDMIGTDGDKVLGSSESLLQDFIFPTFRGRGVFDITWGDFELTDAGREYFVAPAPFHNFVITDGDIEQLSTLQVGRQLVTGDVSAVFVPEPSTIAILALGLLGLGATSRRKS